MRSVFGFVLLLGACGDNSIVDPDGDGLTGGDEVGDSNDGVAPDPGESPRYVPSQCGVDDYSSIALDGNDVDLSIAELGKGAAIFAVPRGGGTVRAALLDGRGNVMGDAAGTAVRAEKYSAIATGYVDERIVLAALGPETITFDLVRNDLGATYQLGEVGGDLLAPITHNRANTRVATVANKSGVNTVKFDQNWNIVQVDQVSKEPVFALAAAQYHDDAMIAWSEEGSCHVRRVDAAVESSRPFACLGARIVMDAERHAGILVSEEDGNVMISDIKVGGESQLANHRVLAENAHSPRVAFDGERYWVSYLNQRDDVTIGFLENGHLTTRSMEGMQPASGAYELAFVNNRMRVFAVEDGGLNAHAMCRKVADQVEIGGTNIAPVHSRLEDGVRVESVRGD